MKIAENVFLKGLKCKNGFNLKRILAVLLPLVMVFTPFYNVSAKEVFKNPPSANFNRASTLDSLLSNKSIIVIRSTINNKVLDLSRGSKEENAQIILYEANFGLNQLWLTEKVEKGYIIRSLFSKKILAINAEFSKEYPLVVQQDYTGKDSQLWLISGTADSLRILNKALQKYLTFSKDYLITGNYSASLSQVWKLESLSKAQNETVSCDCPKNFEYIRNLMETSYPGFRDKVNPQTKSQYEQLRKLSVEKARTTKNSAICFKIIDQYLSFFKDNHVQFSMSDTYEYGFGQNLNPNQIQKFYAGSETLIMSENEVRKYLDSNKSTVAPIEGIWQTQDGIYRCGIVRDKKDHKRFVGFILQADNIYWMPGQVKMNFIKQQNDLYTIYYYRKNHTILKVKNVEYSTGNTFQAGNNNNWNRIYPVIKDSQQPNKAAPKNADGFQLINLDNSTLLLSLPSFDFKNKSLVDNLIKTNKDKLLKTPYLIIDIRGNGGGADETWYSILQYLYTNPYKIIGNDYLSSKANIDALEILINTYGKTEDAKVFLRSQIKRMKENPGKFLESASDGIVKFDAVLPNPRRIAILINNGCASAAEEFLLRAMESKKVVLLGQPTSGTLDYSNLIPGKFPCAAYNISYPFTRTRRLFLVDKEKIKPNIYLTEDQNWIEEAKKQLKATDML